MPTGDDLVGLGLSSQLAEVLGNTPNALTTTGTSQTTAATIKTHNTELVTAGSQTGAIFNSNAKIGTAYFLTTSTATTGVVFVPVGHSLFATPNGSFNLAQNKAAIAWQYKSKSWAYIVLA